MSAIDLRYARALATVAAEQKLKPADVEAQLTGFAAVLASSAELREVLGDPSIPEAQKLRVLDALAARTHMGKQVRNFIALLSHHGRLHDLEAVTAEFAALADEAGHVTEAEITSAHPLDKHSRTLLEQQVAKLSGGTEVRATYSEDAALLGGAVVRIGSTVYDGSVRAQLEQMKARLAAAA